MLSARNSQVVCFSVISSTPKICKRKSKHSCCLFIWHNFYNTKTTCLPFFRTGRQVDYRNIMPYGCSRYRGAALFAVVLVADSELLAAMCAAVCQYATTILCWHTLTETMLVHATAIVWLKCSFHFVLRYLVFIYCCWAIKVATEYTAQFGVQRYLFLFNYTRKAVIFHILERKNIVLRQFSASFFVPLHRFMRI